MVAHLHFRPSEITLLLRPTGGPLDSNTRLSDADLRILSDMSGGMIQPRDQAQLPDELPPSLIGPAGERLPTISPDGGLLLQTLSLKGWELDLPPGNFAAGLATLRQHLIDVTDTVRLLNPSAEEFASGHAKERELSQFNLVTAAPNWLVYPLDCDGGAPGGPPSKHLNPPRSKSFNRGTRRTANNYVADTLANVIINHGDPRKVRVAIMDTFPHRADISQARVRLDQAHKADPSLPRNPRMDALDSNQLFDLWNEVYDFVRKPADIHTGRRHTCCEGAPNDLYDPPYPMPDHGLHVLDIVRDIAPQKDITGEYDVEIAVYRVLDEYGIADMEVLSRAVAQALKDAPEKPLVINLSLGFGPHVYFLPLVLEHPELGLDRDEWAIIECGTKGQIKALPSVKADPAIWALIEESLQPDQDHQRARTLREHPTMAAMNIFLGQLKDFSREVLAVAAAGNDGCTGKPPPPPRFPAVLQTVLGVGSREPGGALCDFTNADDCDATGYDDDGIGAYGRDVVGLHTRPLFPDNGFNDRGWARWTGTSFATPIISAIAARLLAAGANTQQVRDWVKSEPYVRVAQR